MVNRDVIFQMVEYIEDHLREELAVSVLSRNAGYSLYHFIRLFQGVTGFSPKDYILRRKLTEAAKEIIATGRKVIDIAFDYGFNDHETFSRACKRLFGKSPKELRNEDFRGQFPFLDRNAFKTAPSAGLCPENEPEMVLRPSFALVGISLTVDYSVRSLADPWARFMKEADSIPERIKPERFYQFSFWPENHEMEGFFAMPSLEVENLRVIPPTLVGKTVPSGRYLRFIHKGPSSSVGKAYLYIYKSYLPESSFKLTLPYNFEFYGKGFKGPENRNSETEIFIPIEAL
jgi:AraC family transcriptional regulator